jgi:hypothetical protein
MIHQALYNLYPNITSIVDEGDSLKIFEGSKEITDTIDMAEAEAQAAILTEEFKKAESNKKIEDLRQQTMMTGVDFEGVMCSAFKEDQWGLASIKEFVLAGNDVVFQFENENKLTLTSSNIDAFEAVWIPFRQSCLKVNFTG